MSYSFNVRGADKADAAMKVAAELDKVVAGQPNHAADRSQAEAAVASFIGVLGDDPEMEVQVSVNGSLGWYGSSDPTALTNAAISISASLVKREAVAA